MRRYPGDPALAVTEHFGRGVLRGTEVVRELIAGGASDLGNRKQFTDETDLGRLLLYGLQVPRESVPVLWTAVALVAIVVLGDVPGAPVLVFSSFEVLRRNEASLAQFVGAHWKDPLLGLRGCGPSSARLGYRRVRDKTKEKREEREREREREKGRNDGRCSSRCGTALRGCP